MMNDFSIKVESLSKEYILGGAEPHFDSFRDMLMNMFKSPLNKYRVLQGQDKSLKRFNALDDINFEIAPGEIVGVIGHNGAGKSTLLKILSSITTPTKGQVKIKGRVASLLEVGTGFHPELTGRENIYLNGSILGMKLSEIKKYFDEIVEFAGVERFLDTPVKRYSSGMYVRLAFSVAAHLDTDVLLVDEVLSVGDQKFQAKCLGKLEDVSADGRTVIFISHNLSAVSTLCSRGIVLEQGRLLTDSNITDALSVYQESSNSAYQNKPLNESHPVVIKSVDVLADSHPSEKFLHSDSSALIDINIQSVKDLNDCLIEVGIYDQHNQRLVLLKSEQSNGGFSFHEGDNNIKVQIDKLPFVSGQYYLNVAVLRNKELLDVVERAHNFFIKNSELVISNLHENGPVSLEYSWHKKSI